MKRHAATCPGHNRTARRTTVGPAIVLAGGLLALTTHVPELRASGETASGETREEPPARSPVAAGQRVFRAKGCDRCHAVSGAPDQPHVGPPLAGRRSSRDVMQFAGNLWNHTPRMLEAMRAQQVERPAMSAAEMDELLHYLFFLSFLDEPGDLERGQALFAQRSCGHCHQVAGRGGNVGPRLDELAPFVTSLFMAQALWNHGPQMAAKMAELGLQRPRLEEDDLAHILAFLRGKDRPPPSVERVAAECGSPRAGKALFAERGCTGCHTVDGSGGRAGPDLGGRDQWRNVAQMAGTFWNHGPTMWAKMKELGLPFPSLTEREMADIMAYLYFGRFGAEGGDATRGGRVFHDKSCDRCHAAGGEGRAVGPDLAASDASGSSLNWASAMWNHAPAMAEMLRQSEIPWPRFEDDEMRDLVAFLRARRAAR